MAHLAVENKTPFAFEAFFLADEEGRMLFVPIVKATYCIQEGGAIVAGGEASSCEHRWRAWGILRYPATSMSLKRPSSSLLLMLF